MAAIERQQCRYIRGGGVQCRRGNYRGHAYCYAHGRDLEHRRRQGKCKLEIPLLDNRGNIFEFLTDLARAVEDDSCSISKSRALVAIANAAGALLRDQERTQIAAARATASAGSSKAPAGSLFDRNSADAAEDLSPTPVETVSEAELDPDTGDQLAPAAKYYGPNGKPQRGWSFSEYQYRLSFKDFPEREYKPLPEEGFRTDLEGTRYVESERFWRPKLPSDVEAIEENERHMQLVHANKIALGQIPEGTPYETECGILLRASEKWKEEQAAAVAAGLPPQPTTTPVVGEAARAAALAANMPRFNPADFPPHMLEEHWNNVPTDAPASPAPDGARGRTPQA